MAKSQTHMRQILFKAEFAPDIHFFQAITNIVDYLYPEYLEHWQVESQISCSLFSRLKRASCTFNAGELLFVFNTTDDALVLETIKRCLEIYSKHVKIKNYKRVGLRYYDFTEVEMKNSELADLISSKYHTKEKFFTDIFSSKMNDLAVLLDFQKDKFNYHFKLGPGPKHQIRALVPLLFEEPIKSFHFNSNKDLSEYIGKIPEQSLFMDIDCYLNDSKGDLISLYKEMSANIASMKAAVSKSIFGK